MLELDDLSESDRYQRFDDLQRHMSDVWQGIGQDHDNESVVVVPSISLDGSGARGGTMLQAYEERFLFLLLLLRQPRLRLIYVTSQPIAPLVIEYYLSLLSGVIPSHARSRLALVSLNDSSPGPLSAKLLERPRFLARIASLIPDRDRCHLVPYVTTTMERDLALALSIPMYGADPRLFPLGTKSGSRQLFRDEGVACPDGFEDLHSVEELVSAIGQLRLRCPELDCVVVKLNQGVAGHGNGQVDLTNLPASGDPTESQELLGRVRRMRFDSPDTDFEDYARSFAGDGGIVEARISGEEFRSPSVQMRITPFGEVELLSTHDQILGGAAGQSYLGCRFPADPQYASLILGLAEKIGQRLVREGVLGRFAVDFVVVRDARTTWKAYAIELNLRKGGTTHPFLTMQFLTDGTFDARTGEFRAPNGTEKFLVASDHLEAPALKGLSIDDLFDLMARRGLHFDQSRQRGVVFHMISSITEHGRIGLTSIDDTAKDAEALYERAEAVLLEEARLMPSFQ